MTAIPSNWYTEFFNEDYPKIYSERLSQDATERETAFAVQALGLQEGDRVLDLACGHGRHAVALARRGMVVTGQDLNEDYLRTAQRRTRRGRVSRLRPSTATCATSRSPTSSTRLSTCSLPSGTSIRKLRTCGCCWQSPTPSGRGGKLLLDTINREWVLSNYVQNDWHTDGDGNTFLEHREFDLVTGRNRVTFSIVTADGTRRESPGHDVRLYTLTELVRLLDIAGLRLSATYGDYDSAPYAINTPRMIVVATTKD